MPRRFAPVQNHCLILCHTSECAPSRLAASQLTCTSEYNACKISPSVFSVDAVAGESLVAPCVDAARATTLTLLQSNRRVTEQCSECCAVAIEASIASRNAHVHAHH